MRVRRAFRFVIAILPGIGIGLGLGPAAGPAKAQNGIVNADFDVADQLTGWIENGVWSPIDWEGLPDSGSVLNSNSCPFVGCSSLVRQCVPVTEGERYRVEARVRVDPGQPSGDVLLRVSWRSASACYPAAPAVDQSVISVAAATGEWELVGGTFTAPAGAQGADLQLAVLKDSASGSLAARFDAVSVPEAEVVVAAPAALAALAVIRLLRRRTAAAD
jgi:hypothetical protein